MFAGNKSDNFNLDLNGPAIGENDNGKEHPVNKLKQKLNDEKKLDKEKSENYDSLGLKIEAERREKTKKEEDKIRLMHDRESLNLLKKKYGLL